ncbi:MAG: hypothetical protein PHH30_02020 [Bacteroidales bacterium]|nr:hypothetical protein [Bacteroidales bacterium]
MSSNKNIEDLFRSELGDFKVNPSDKVWSGINKRMCVPRFNAIYRNAFSAFKLSPSDHVWRRVAAFVWLNKFIHFTPFSFNIYYLGIIITAVVGTVITVNNNPNLNFVHFDPNTKTVEIVDDSNSLFNIPDPTDYINSQIAENNSDADKETAIIYDKLDADPDFNVEKEIILPINENTNNLNTETNIVIQNQEQNNIISQNNYINTENLTTNEVDNKIPELSDLVNIPVEQIVEKESSIKVDIKTERELLPTRLLLNKIQYLKYRPDWSEFADLKLSEIPYLNPIVYDTLGYNHAGDPIIVEKSWFTIDLFYSPYLHSYSNKLLNTELEQNYSFYSSNNKPIYSYSAGVGLSFNYKRLRIESGFSHMQMRENLNQTVKIYDTITNYQYNYFENHSWNYDTTMILDLNEYLAGNIVYIEYVDSCMFYYTDSVMTEYLDSVQIDKLMQAENAYHIVDIPVIVGYEFNYNNFSITPKAGIITSYLTKRTGTAYNIMAGEIVNANDLPSSKLLFNYYAGINLQYRISKNLAIFIEPHIRSDINSLYKNSYAINEKSMKYGVKTGISFKF